MRGFTLVELMTTIAIAAILLSAGIPALSDFLRDQRLAQASNALAADLAAARAEAARTFTMVRVCASASGNACDGADWSAGRIVYADTNANGAVEATEIIRWSQAPGTGVVATATGVGTEVAFRPTGVALVAGAIDLCDGRSGPLGRRVDVNAAGRISARALDCP